MKPYCILFFCIIFSTGTLLAQTEDIPQPNYTSISFDGGFIKPLKVFNNTYKTGSSFGLDVAMNHGPRHAIFLNLNYDILSAKDSIGITNRSSNILEGLAGIRVCAFKHWRGNQWNLEEELRQGFILEVGVGYFFYEDSYKYNGHSVSTSSSDFGAFVGVGYDFMIAKRTSMFVKARLNSANWFNSVNEYSFLRITVGIRILPKQKAI